MKINCEVRYASHQDDAKHYDTATLRKHYLVENVMVPDQINMVYSMFDRIIAGGAVPVRLVMKLPFWVYPSEVSAVRFPKSRACASCPWYSLD